VLTYRLVSGNGADDEGYTGSNIRIRDTFMDLGNSTSAAGPGTLILRVPGDDEGNPAAGKAEVLYYHLAQHFTTTTGTTVVTEVDGSSPEFGRSDNTDPVATGDFTLGAAPRIEWRPCTYPDGYDETPDSFTPDVVGEGEGCMAPFRSVGNVNCSGALCGAGNLQEGDNPQDWTWEQRLEPVAFARDLSTLTMKFAQIPNRSPSRTYMSWGGELDGIECR
jgi:hypothetical protein